MNRPGLFFLLASPLLAGQAPPVPPALVSAPVIEPLKTTVTVIGTRSAMEMDQSPVSTSLATSEDMERRNVRQVDQALEFTLGVIAVRTRGPADNDFGLGLRGFAGRGGQSRTLILMDGQPMNNSYTGNVTWSMFSVSEMERVEVARGPFSSLYGGNAMGGVVNLITKPVQGRALEVLAQYGSFDTVNYSIRAAERLFSRLGLSAGYSRFQTGGYSPQEILRPTVAATGGTMVTGVRRWLTPTGGLTYQVGDRGRNWFNQEGYRIRGEYSVASRVFASLQYLRQSRMEGYDAYTTNLRDRSGSPVESGTVAFVDADGVTRRLSVSPSNYIGTPTGASLNTVQAQALASLTTHWSLKAAAGTNDSPSDWYVTPGINATLAGGSGGYVNQVNRSFYGNVQATWASSGQTAILGTEFRHDRARIASQTIPNYAIRANGGPFETQAKGRAANQSAYAQYQFNATDNLLIVAGGRWDGWRTYDGYNQTSVASGLEPYPERSTNSLTGKIALTWRLPGQWQLRGSLGNAFRNPTVYDLYRNLSLGGTLYLANPNVKPERLFAYEAGAMRRVRGLGALETTFFVNRVTDLIYRTTDFAADPSGRIRRLGNVGRGRVVGLEMSARQEPRRWLRLQQSYSWTRAKIVENPALPATVGKRLPHVPEHNLSFLTTAAWKRWNATWGGRYVSGTYSTDTNVDVVRGVPGSYSPFFETDVTVAYEVNRQLSLHVTADNLLDRRYYVYYSTAGRTVFAGLRWRL